VYERNVCWAVAPGPAWRRGTPIQFGARHPTIGAVPLSPVGRRLRHRADAWSRRDQALRSASRIPV